MLPHDRRFCQGAFFFGFTMAGLTFALGYFEGFVPFGILCLVSLAIAYR